MEERVLSWRAPGAKGIFLSSENPGTKDAILPVLFKIFILFSPIQN
jgi:hypothetical protein